MDKLRKRAAFLASIFVAGFLLYVVLRKAGAAGVQEFFTEMPWWVILCGVGVYTGEMFVRAFRWKTILQINKIEVSLVDCFLAYSLGNGLNIFMPAKLGDVARSYYLKRKQGAKYMDTIPTTLMDRFYDIVGIYLVLLFVLAFIISTIKLEKWLGILVVVGFAALIIGYLVLEIFHRNRKLLHLLPGVHLKKLAEALLISYEGALRDWKGFLKLGLHSFIIWGLECVTAFVIFYGAGVNIPPAILAFGLMIGTLTKAVPITPGGIGVFEGVMVLCFAMFSYSDPNIGVGAAIFHLILNVYGAVIAIGILIRNGIRTSDIQRGDF